MSSIPSRWLVPSPNATPGTDRTLICVPIAGSRKLLCKRLSHIMLYVDGKSKLAKIALIPCNLLGDKVRLKHASLYQKGKGRCLGRNDLAESAPLSGRVSSNGRCGDAAGALRANETSRPFCGNSSAPRWKASGSADLSRFATRLVSHTCHPRGFLTCTPHALRKRGRGISMIVYYRGKRAQSYDQRYQHLTACTLSATLALMNVEAIAEQAQQDRRVPRLLDVACGTGVLLSLLHERFPTAELTGIDSSQHMLAQAQARLSGIAHLRPQHAARAPAPHA